MMMFHNICSKVSISLPSNGGFDMSEHLTKKISKPRVAFEVISAILYDEGRCGTRQCRQTADAVDNGARCVVESVESVQ